MIQQRAQEPIALKKSTPGMRRRIETFEKRWAEGTRERLAFALLLYTGQRGSDVHRMSWADYVGDAIRVAQQKTATKLTIPASTMNLAGLLAMAKRDHLDYSGDSFQEAVFGKRFRQHGVRRDPRRRTAPPLQAAWATEGGCATSCRGGLLSKRDHGDHRTQDACRGGALHARCRTGTVGAARAIKRQVRKQKWQT